MKNKTFILLLMFFSYLTLSKPCQAQFKDLKNEDWFIEADARYAKNIPFVERHAYIKDFPQYGLDLRLGKQTDGTKEFEQRFNFPTYGLMLRYEHNTLDSAKRVVRMPNDEILTEWESIGDCLSLGVFFNGHLYRAPKWSFDYDVIGGLSFWAKHGNEFIGTFMNVHLSLDAGPTVQISKNMDLLARVVFAHSSNGALHLPNHGVNTYSYLIGCRYHPNERADIKRTELEKFDKTTSIYFQNAVGALQTRTTLNDEIQGETPYYFGDMACIGIRRQFHPKFAYDIGFDFGWTGETRRKYEKAQAAAETGELSVPLEEYSFWKGTHAGIAATFEIVYDRFAFCIGGAYYLYHGIYAGNDQKKSWKPFGDNLTDFERQYLPNAYRNCYERIGLKYYLGKNRNQYVGAFMKTHFDSIDYIEWTYGINLFSWNHSKKL